MQKILKIIGERIAQKRRELGLSQEQLAERSKLHRNYIGNIERAERRVTVSSLYKVAVALDVSLEKLFKDL